MSEANTGSGELLRYSLFVLLAAASIFIMWFGMDAFDQYFKPQAEVLSIKSGSLLPQPRTLQPIHLLNPDATPLTLDTLRGKWTLLAIGYTSCPDVCPTLMATFKMMDKLFTQAGKQDAINFLFISIDPERDSPKQVGNYVHYFNPRFLGATGMQEQLHILTGQLGLMYARGKDQTSAMGYMVDHSASIVLLDPETRWTAIFSPPHDPQALAEDVLAVMARNSK